MTVPITLILITNDNLSVIVLSSQGIFPFNK